MEMIDLNQVNKKYSKLRVSSSVNYNQESFNLSLINQQDGDCIKNEEIRCKEKIYRTIESLSNFKDEFLTNLMKFQLEFKKIFEIHVDSIKKQLVCNLK